MLPRESPHIPKLYEEDPSYRSVQALCLITSSTARRSLMDVYDISSQGKCSREAKFSDETK